MAQDSVTAAPNCPAGQNRGALWWQRWQRVAAECPRHASVEAHRRGDFAHGTTPYGAGVVCVQNAQMAVGWIPGWRPTLRQALAWVRDRGEKGERP